MKICYVYDAVYPWETGGVQKRVWELARRLADDHDVHWYGHHYWDGPGVIERESVTLHGVGYPPDLYVDGRRSIPEALSFSAKLVRPLLRESFDVVDCQEFPYFPAFPSKLHSATRGSTLVLTWHEVWDDYWREYLGWKGAFGKAVERLTARVPDSHVAVSERTQRDVRALGGRGTESALVPNGISMAEIEAAPAADRDVDVLFVGRFIREKNPRLVVEAVDRLRAEPPDINAVLVGDGPERSGVEARISDRGLDDAVTVLPPRDAYEDVLGLMKAADVFVLPSRREGFGITVLEALACGTPVVTIRHPQNAATELVDDGTTGAIRAATSDGIAGGIRDARDLSADDCIATARDYEWDRIAERMESVYREAVR